MWSNLTVRGFDPVADICISWVEYSGCNASVVSYYVANNKSQMRFLKRSSGYVSNC